MSCLQSNRKWVGLTLSCLTLWLASCAAGGLPRNEARSRQQADARITIPAIDIKSHNGTVHITMTGSQPFSHTIASYDTPPRIVVDIPHARFVEKPALFTVKQGGVSQVNFVDIPAQFTVQQGGVSQIKLQHITGEAAGASLDIHLTAKTTYNVTKDGERLRIAIHQPPRIQRTSVRTTKQEGTPSGFSFAEQDYRVGAQDVLDITIFREPELSKTYQVSGEGFITFPLIGKVNVRGLTTTEIENALIHRLSPNYLVQPQISVALAEYKSQQIFVLGAVQRPGQFFLHGPTTLLEMLSRAGGLRHQDGRSNVLVLLRHRTPSGPQQNVSQQDVQTIRIDLERLLDHGEMHLNVPVQQQDVIYVPQPASIFVFGQVKSPGPVLVSGTRMTLMQAISKAGGFTRIAAPNRTRVIRVVDGEERSMRINVATIIQRGDRNADIVLQPDDIIVVPESLF